MTSSWQKLVNRKITYFLGTHKLKKVDHELKLWKFNEGSKLELYIAINLLFLVLYFFDLFSIFDWHEFFYSCNQNSLVVYFHNL